MYEIKEVENVEATGAVGAMMAQGASVLCQIGGIWMLGMAIAC